MPEHLRAFLVINVLMAVAYAISRRLFAHAVEPKFVGRLYATGYAATAIMFLAHNMWVFLAGLAVLSLLAVRRFTHPLALFVFLLLLMPEFSARVPGFGLVNWLIDLKAWRVLALTVLLPATFYLLHNPQLPRPGKLLADKAVIAYVLYATLLSYIHYETFTGGMRHLVVIILDMALLYFVASRGLMLKGAVRHVIVALVTGAIFLALIGTFEFTEKWLLYAALIDSLGTTKELYFGYTTRGSTLRALATTGQSIAFGFIMMVALLATLYVQKLVQSGLHRTVLWELMAMGLVAAMSRGPWVGTAIGLFVAALISANPVGNVLKLTVAGMIAPIVLFILPGGERLTAYLPWVGSIDTGNITYRELLWEKSLVVWASHPWIGSADFLDNSAFDVIRFGSGAVDVVNTYIGVLLSHGLIGLCLYLLIIAVALMPVCVAVIRNRMLTTESQLSGVALVSASVASLVTIWTVSSIAQIAPMITLLAGWSAAHAWVSNHDVTVWQANHPERMTRLSIAG